MHSLATQGISPTAAPRTVTFMTLLTRQAHLARYMGTLPPKRLTDLKPIGHSSYKIRQYGQKWHRATKSPDGPSRDGWGPAARVVTKRIEPTQKATTTPIGARSPGVRGSDGGPTSPDAA